MTKKEKRKIESWIIFEDEHIIALNKPNGIAVQGGTNIKKSLDRILLKLREGTEIKLVHRLDKDTSGVIVVAKSRIAAMGMANLFKRARTSMIGKYYLAMLTGTPLNFIGKIK